MVYQIRGVAPRHKITSLGPFNGDVHQTFSTIRTALRALPHDVQDVEGKKSSSSHHSVSAKKIKTLTG